MQLSPQYMQLQLCYSYGQNYALLSLSKLHALLSHSKPHALLTSHVNWLITLHSPYTALPLTLHFP